MLRNNEYEITEFVKTLTVDAYAFALIIQLSLLDLLYSTGSRDEFT